MKLVVIILNKTECLEKLLETFKDNGLSGATIIDSKGMIQELSDNYDFRIAGSLREIFMPSHKENKTILMDEATGGLAKPDTGILFTLPIDHLEGMRE